MPLWTGRLAWTRIVTTTNTFAVNAFLAIGARLGARARILLTNVVATVSTTRFVVAIWFALNFIIANVATTLALFARLVAAWTRLRLTNVAVATVSTTRFTAAIWFALKAPIAIVATTLVVFARIVAARTRLRLTNVVATVSTTRFVAAIWSALKTPVCKRRARADHHAVESSIAIVATTIAGVATNAIAVNA